MGESNKNKSKENSCRENHNLTLEKILEGNLLSCPIRNSSHDEILNNNIQLVCMCVYVLHVDDGLR